jgi:hypothetical protein
VPLVVHESRDDVAVILEQRLTYSGNPQAAVNPQFDCAAPEQQQQCLTEGVIFAIGGEDDRHRGEAQYGGTQQRALFEFQFG